MRELTGARVTDANGTVAENLNRHARGAQRGNLVDRQLACRRHALDSQLVGSQSHGALAMDARLRGQVNLDPGNRRAQRASQPGIRHDQGIGTQRIRVRSQRHRVCQLVVEHKNIERHVHTHAMGMRHGAAARKLVIRKAMRAHAGVKAAQPRIDGIGTRGDGRKHLVEPARRRQQLGQRHTGSIQSSLVLSGLGPIARIAIGKLLTKVCIHSEKCRLPAYTRPRAPRLVYRVITYVHPAPTGTSAVRHDIPGGQYMGPRQRQGRSRSKTHALPIILLSFLGFLLIAGVAFGIGMVGNVNRWLSDLPDYTDANAYLVSEPTEIVDCNGNKIASFYTQNRKSITKDEVSPYVLQGTVDVEDERFYEHGGIDLWGIARAAVATLGGGHEGASTITQQLVRNTILQEEQFDSTIERKVREAYIAVKMEDMYSKDEILMMYLNTIYYGHGAYGIEAAAETYLSKSAADLTLSEAALLIGLPNSPSQYDPTVNPDLALSRRNKVLDNMLRLGHITQEEHDAAQAEPITLNVTEISGSGVDVYSQPYFVSYVKQLLEQEFSTDVLFKGGLTVKTTIDPTMQQVAENAVREQLDTLSLDGLDMGMVVVDPKTGYIKCMVGGYDYNADENHVNHATAKRPVGSTFKAFTLATAIQNGMNPNVTLNCNSPLKAKGTTTEFQNYANQSYGNITLKQATAYSSNTGYIQVAEAVGNSKIISLVKKLGIDPAKDNIEDVPVMTLGTGSISPLEMAAAYATFANGGYYRQPIAITEIDSRTGSVLYQHTDNPSQVLTEGEAAAVTDVLSGVMKGSGTGAAGA